MGNESGVNNSESSPDQGRTLENLQSEFSRKLEKMQEETSAKLEALTQKLDSLTVADEPVSPTEPMPYDKKEELIKISADPLRYVEDKVAPLKEKASQLEKELQEQRKAVLTSQWERMEDRIARAEGKKDWTDMTEEFRKEIRQEIINRNWQANPAHAMDAYDIVKARKVNSSSSEPDRLARIRDNQPEGAGRRTGTQGTVQSVPRSHVTELASTPPSHPDYKKNMETLDKVQKGYIKVEG